MRKIIFTRPDGGLSVVTPVRNTRPAPETLTEEEIEQRALAKLPTDAISPVFVDPSVIPTDRTDRNYWKWDGNAIVVDVPAAVIAERVRVAALDDSIRSDATLAQLKAMTNAEFDTWWAANVTNAAQAIQVLKRLARVIIRRVL